MPSAATSPRADARPRSASSSGRASFSLPAQVSTMPSLVRGVSMK